MEYLICDEADRLFELGFVEQVRQCYSSCAWHLLGAYTLVLRVGAGDRWMGSWGGGGGAGA